MSNQKGFFEELDIIAAETTVRKDPGKKTEPGAAAQTFYTPPGAETETDEAAADKKPDETKMDAEKIKQAGRNSAILTAGCLESVFMLVERMKYIFSFTADEKEKILLIQDKEDKDLDEKERMLNRKFLRINKKHEDLKKKLDFTQKEEDAMAEGFAEYTRATGKSLGPNVILYTTIGKALVNRSIEIFL